MRQKVRNRFLAAVLAAAMMFQMLPLMAFAAEGDSVEAGKARIGETVYGTLKEAVEAAASGDTITLGEGNYTLYGISSTNTTKGKDLTFVGQGAEKTAWNIGAEVPDPANYGMEYNGDYSFDGAGTVTFKDMTMRSGTANYLGFIRPDKTVVEDCVINGKTFYWGYTSAEFIKTTFNAPSFDYAVWTYSSPVMTFDSCTFNASGKVVNVYTDYSAGKHDITVNFKDCTVNSTSSASAGSFKTALNINDSNMGSYKYILNITGSNDVTAARDKTTCSQIFGFGGKPASDTGRTEVSIDGKLVWGKKDGEPKGELKTHEHSDGAKDGKVTTSYGEWDMTETPAQRTVTEDCDYCTWHKETVETGHKLSYDLNGGTEAAGEDYSEALRGESNTLAAAPTLAGYSFVGWRVNNSNVTYPAGTKLSEIEGISQAEEIKVEAVWEEDTPGDEPSADGGSGDAVFTAVAVTAGAAGAAVFGYYLGTELLMQRYGMPYLPANRSELAMMLWEDAGKPMPESALLYPDIGTDEQEMALQYAARWAVENDLMVDLNMDSRLTEEEKKFDPDVHVSRAGALRAWRKAQELKKNA